MTTDEELAEEAARARTRRTLSCGCEVSRFTRNIIHVGKQTACSEACARNIEAAVRSFQQDMAITLDPDGIE